MRSETAIVIRHRSNISSIPIEKGLLYYRAETQEILDHADFFKNLDLYKKQSPRGWINKNHTRLICSYKDCINFFEKLKSFARLHKEPEKYWAYDSKKVKGREVIYIGLENPKSKIVIKGDLSEKIKEFLI